MIILTRGYGQTDRPTDRPTDQPTDRPTDIATYRAAIAAKKRVYLRCTLFRAFYSVHFTIDVCLIQGLKKCSILGA